MAFEHTKSAGGFGLFGGGNSSYGARPVNPFTPGLNSSYSTKPPNPFTPGLNSSYNAGGLMRNNKGGGNGNGANGNAPKTGGKLPPTPATPTPQWAFQPSPYDQSPSGGPGPASQYEVNLPTQPWMLNPMGQPPQQMPQAPQQQQWAPQYNEQWAPQYPQYNQQWAPPYPPRY
jgi:hypothetical protein